MLAKQVLSQLSYTPTAGLTLILEHFPIFCLSVFTFFGLTVPLPCTIALDVLDRAQSTHVLNG
jgi:hypothetical protein